MKEAKGDLFRPPGGTGVVIVPVLGEVIQGLATLALPAEEQTENDRHAAQLAAMLSGVERSVGLLFERLGAGPHPITQNANPEGTLKRVSGQHKVGRLLSYHLLVLPYRPTRKAPVTVDYLASNVRRMRRLLDDVSWLREQAGDVVLPRISAPDQDWTTWRSYWETWLPEARFVVLEDARDG